MNLLKGIQLLLVSAIFFSQVNARCNTNCSRNASCSESLNAIRKTIGYGKEYLCYQKDLCHGGPPGDTSKVPVQQFPIILLENQYLIIEISDFFLTNYTFSIVKTSQFEQFATCNTSSDVDIVLYSIINSSSLQIHPLGVGVHYLLFESNHILYSCRFGFRVELTVYEHKCNFIDNSNPCLSNGCCILNGTAKRFECSCFDNYYGDRCQELDGCKIEENTCLPNGDCHDYVAGANQPGFNCSCHEQFSGDKCDQCIQGFTGINCQTDINECAVNPNLCNFGECVNKNSNFQCVCPVNVTGLLCETDTFDNCISSPCNGTNRTCVDNYGSHECQCPADYTGKSCEVKIDNCVDGNCDLDGTETCANESDSYICNCKSGYTGIKLS